MTNEPKQPGVTPGSQKVAVNSPLDPSKNNTTIIPISYFKGDELNSAPAPSNFFQLKGAFQSPTDHRASLHLAGLWIYETYIRPNLIHALREENIKLKLADAIVLRNLISSFALSREVQYPKKRTFLEKEICDTTEKLIHLLEQTGEDKRSYWDLSKEEISTNKQNIIYIEDLIQNLQILHRASKLDLIEFQTSIKNPHAQATETDMIPRHFYWVAIGTFWVHYLGRDLATSVNNHELPNGPCIRYFQTMTAENNNLNGEITPNSIRSWINRNKHDAAGWASYLKKF